jgi:drug/metabolite transporter (DMT)-like permease
MYVALAAVAWSTAGVLQRELHVDLGTQVTGRALFAFAALAIFVAAGHRHGLTDQVRESGWAMLGVSVSTALASAAFIVALNYTTVARVLFLQAAAPMFAALLAWVSLGEPVTARFAFAVPFAHPGTVDGRNLVLLILLGAGQIGLGLALLSIGARLIPAAEIATITLLEVVLGPLWVWIVVSERPSTATLIGGAIVTVAVLLQAGGEPATGVAEVSPPPP